MTPQPTPVPEGASEGPPTVDADTLDTLQQEHEILLQFFYLAPVGLVETRNDGTITMMNPAAARWLLPLAPGGLLTNLFEVLEPLLPHARERAAEAPTLGSVLFENKRLQLPPGKVGEAAVMLDLNLTRRDRQHLMATLTDATASHVRERRQLSTRLRDATHLDTLTGLPSRNLVLERVQQALARVKSEPGWRFAVLQVNLDRFSRVNVALGTGAGDAVLRLVAQRLQQAVRSQDLVAQLGQGQPLAARLGGDEFLVLLEGIQAAEDAVAVAHRLADVVSKPYGMAGDEVFISACVSVVVREDADADPETVLHDANSAMREGKRAGGDRVVVFDPAHKRLAARRALVENDLRRALQAPGELFVVYQPIMSLSDHSCVGLEALVRWRHPERGLIPPVEFIPVAEDGGLIAPLGGFVLRTACAQFARWRTELGELAPRTLSVNVSRAQLLDKAFLDEVRSALEASGLPGRHLQLEVTESMAAQDGQVQKTLSELKSLGLTVALDDFGTGYSSLSSLHLLPVDVVKIDRSFVSQSEASAHHQALIQATVQVARSLGMGTVAEGIETVGQQELLEALACDKGQGYLYAKPLNAEEVPGWLRQRPVVG